MRKSFKTRLWASMFVWTIILLLAISFGFLINSRSEKRKALLGAQLPNVGLASAKGKISIIDFSGSERRGTFGTPGFEFEARLVSKSNSSFVLERGPSIFEWAKCRYSVC